MRPSHDHSLQPPTHAKAEAEPTAYESEPGTLQAHQSFLLALTDAIRAESDPEQILAETAERLGRHLQVSRVAYVEANPDNGVLTHLHEWTDGPPPLGIVSGDMVDEQVVDALGRGDTVRVCETGSWRSDRAKFARSVQVRAFLTVPIMKAGRQVGSLSLTDHRPRNWDDREAELAREVAERTWETRERARAEAALRLALANQEFLVRLGDLTRDEADPEAILEVTAEQLHRHLGISRVAYLEVAAEGDVIELASQWTYGISGLVTTKGGFDEVDEATTRRLRTGQVIRVNNVRDCWPKAAAQIAAANHAIAFMCVPLLKGGRYVAQLGLTHHEPREWTDAEATLAKEVAERTWETLQRARVETDLRTAKATQTFLLKLSDATRDELDARVILETTARLLGEHLGVSRVVYSEIEASGDAKIPRRQWANGVAPFPDTQTRDVDLQSLQRLRGGEILKVHDVLDEKQLSGAEFLVEHDTRAYLCIPLLKGGRHAATMTITDHRPRKWQDWDVELVREVSERTWSSLQRARAEADLRDSQALFSAFMENAPIGMYLKDEQGRYLIANAEMEKLFGRSIGEVLGRTAHELCGPDEAREVAKWDRQLVETGQSFAFEQERPGATTYRSALVMRFPVRAGSGEPLRIGGFDIDLTEQKQMEAELEKSREALYQSEKLTALGSLLAGVSHELNNPLSVVVGQALIMEQKASDQATALRAAKIRSAAERCAKIVQTFLAMARQRQPERQRVDVNELIEAAVDLTAYGLRAGGVSVRLELAPDLPRLLADASQLHQLFANLIVNAQHALESVSGPRHLRIATQAGDGAVRIEVTDNGPGIPADIRHRIFEPFFTTKPIGSGTGLGLSFAYGVAEAHGGELKLEDAGPGATFAVTLPLECCHSEAPALAAQVPSEGGRGRVLVVDDELELAETLAEMLECQGWTAEIANGGRSAIDRLAASEFDLVITDVRMPDLDGAELFAWVKANRPGLEERFAFLTGDTLGASAGEFLAEAGRPYANKPFSPASIEELVKQVQERRGNICNPSRETL